MTFLSYITLIIDMIMVTILHLSNKCERKLRFKRDQQNIQGSLEDRSNKGTKDHDHENFVSSKM
jgi:hypothetical protein